MVEFPIADTHVHYWDVSRFNYPWHKMESKVLERNFLPQDYSEAVKDYDVQKILLVEAGCEPGEFDKQLEWFSGLADIDSRISGIITRFDVGKGRHICEDIYKARRNGLIKGGRTALQFDADPAACLKPEFLEGVLQLEGTGLVLQVGMDWRQIKSFGEFLDRLDGRVPCVIDHMGYPDIGGRPFEIWAQEFKHLSDFDNVSCKISSLPTRLEANSPFEDLIKPYAVFALKSFGENRVMFGSDWPTVLKNSDFVSCADMTEGFADAAGFNGEGKKKLFLKNAEMLYGI